MDKYKAIRAYRTGLLLSLTDWLTVLPGLRMLACATATSVTAKGMEHIQRRKGYLFLTNHRDIVMDSAWLSMLLREQKNIRPYIGIGNNLFGRRWIEPFVRFNRVFVVIRDGGIREQIHHSTLLSCYIADRIHARHSVWLAQREGRAKDGNDRTQPAVLKMLLLSTPKTTHELDHLMTLNICPTCINYEFDPCDYLKAQEMQLKRDNPTWKKSKADDLLSMKTGIHGRKGRVVFHVAPSINPWLESHRTELIAMTRNDMLNAIAQHIDFEIHCRYEHYERGQAFDEYIEQQLQKVNLPNPDWTFLRDKMYEMYNNPVKNYLQTQHI